MKYLIVELVIFLENRIMINDQTVKLRQSLGQRDYILRSTNKTSFIDTTNLAFRDKVKVGIAY